MVYKCDALRDLVQFVQFKKHEKTYRGVLLLLKLQAFIKVVTLLKVTLLHVRLSLFFFKWYKIARNLSNRIPTNAKQVNTYHTHFRELC